MKNHAKRKNEHGRRLAANVVLLLIAFALSIGAAALFRGVFVYERTVSRVLTGIGGALCAIVGAFSWLVLIAALSAGGHRNLFLYDRKAKTALPMEALDWPLVRARLGEYVHLYLRRGSRRYLPLPLQPLFMPYLLLVFLDAAPDSDWDKLFEGESAILGEMIEGLSRFGLTAPAEILAETAPRYCGNPGSVKLALSRHRASVESAILDHIREHITEYEM